MALYKAARGNFLARVNFVLTEVDVHPDMTRCTEPMQGVSVQAYMVGSDRVQLKISSDSMRLISWLRHWPVNFYVQGLRSEGYVTTRWLRRDKDKPGYWVDFVLPDLSKCYMIQLAGKQS